MKFSPSDFFIGLIDFFSVLLPGAILCWTYSAGINLLMNNVLDFEQTTFTAVFLIASYIAGHFIYSLGSLFDEYVYEYFRKLFYKNRDGAYTEANAIKNEIVSGKLNPGANTAINLYKWAKGVIEIIEPPLITPIHKFEADQKFFRSFAIVAVINACYFGVTKDLPIMGFWILVFLLSLYRYINRRFKGTRQAFETILVMRSLGKV
jgi:hypothetical protein